MRTLILTAVIVSAAGNITPIQNEAGIKDRLMEMLQQHDTAVSFDASLTDELAHALYTKYATQSKNSNVKGIKVGERRPFPKKQGLDKNGDRKLLLDSDGWDTEDKQKVLDLHNNYRSNLASGNEADDGTDGTYPAASNMNELLL